MGVGGVAGVAAAAMAMAMAIARQKGQSVMLAEPLVLGRLK